MSFIYSWMRGSNQTPQTPAVTPQATPANANDQGAMTLPDGQTIIIQQNPTRRAPLPTPQKPSSPDGSEEEMLPPLQRIIDTNIGIVDEEIINAPKRPVPPRPEASNNPFLNSFFMQPNPFIKAGAISSPLPEAPLKEPEPKEIVPSDKKSNFVPELDVGLLPKAKQPSLLSKLSQKVSQKITQTIKYYTTYVDPVKMLWENNAQDPLNMIFSDFNTKNIQTCRLVNKQWKTFSNPMFHHAVCNQINLEKDPDFLRWERMLRLYSEMPAEERYKYLRNCPFKNEFVLMLELIQEEAKNKESPNYIKLDDYIGVNLKKNHDFLLNAIAIDNNYLHLIPDDYYSDLDFITKLITSKDKLVTLTLMTKIRDNEIRYNMNFMLKFIETDRELFYSWHQDKFADQRFMLDLIRENPTTITFATPEHIQSPKFWWEAFSRCRSLDAFDELQRKFKVCDETHQKLSLSLFSDEFKAKIDKLRSHRAYDDLVVTALILPRFQIILKNYLPYLLELKDLDSCKTVNRQWQQFFIPLVSDTILKLSKINLMLKSLPDRGKAGGTLLANAKFLPAKNYKCNQLLHLYFEGSTGTRMKLLNNPEFNSNVNIMIALLKNYYSSDPKDPSNIDPRPYAETKVKNTPYYSKVLVNYELVNSCTLKGAVHHVLYREHLINRVGYHLRTNTEFWLEIFQHCNSTRFKYFTEKYFKMNKDPILTQSEIRNIKQQRGIW